MIDRQSEQGSAIITCIHQNAMEVTFYSSASADLRRIPQRSEDLH